MIRTTALLMLLSATAAHAQDGPSFDCAKAESSAEILLCQDADLAALDRLVSDRYAAAMEVARGLDAGAAKAEQDLRAEQRGWIKGRDACWKAGDERDCVEAAYLRREGDLVARWMLQPPTGIAFWACDGNPANEVVTYFYDTTRPSVRFERGDSIDTGALVRTASGAKYEAPFGRSIWIKGDAATYRDSDPDGRSLECILARSE